MTHRIAPPRQRLLLSSVVACLAFALASNADAQIGRRTETDKAFRPDDSIFSALSSDDAPSDPGPGADELAPTLGLVKGRTHRDITYWTHEKTGMEFVFVPGGTFQMGSNYADIYQHTQVRESLGRASVRPRELDGEQPQVPVYISPYFIGAYEVTNGEYAQFLAAVEAGEPVERFPFAPPDSNHRPWKWQAFEGFSGERQPVVAMTWFDAWSFAKWMGARLPTEAEWEKAARGTDGRIFPWGNRFDPMRANTKEGLNGRTLNVGMYEGGRSPYGCYDMAGNAAEFVHDAFEDTISKYRTAKDPALLERIPLSKFRTLRGGSWNLAGHLYKARTATRLRLAMQPRYSPAAEAEQYLHVGFRVVLSPHKLYPDGWVKLLDERAN